MDCLRVLIGVPAVEIDIGEIVPPVIRLAGLKSKLPLSKSPGMVKEKGIP